jgi:hypothetical protein
MHHPANPVHCESAVASTSARMPAEQRITAVSGIVVCVTRCPLETA